MKHILLVLAVVILVGLGYWYFSREAQAPEEVDTTLGETMENPDTNAGMEGEMSESGPATHFAEVMQQTYVEEGGHPIEGIEPMMFIEVYPGLSEEDFDGVEASQGVYAYTDGELTFTQTEQPEHSAARAITEEGMETLLANVSERLDLPAETTEDIDTILTELESSE